MSVFWSHVILFLALSFAIVVMGAFYAEPEDAPALRSVPRRYAVFVVACGGDEADYQRWAAAWRRVRTLPGNGASP